MSADWYRLKEIEELKFSGPVEYTSPNEHVVVYVETDGVIWDFAFRSENEVEEDRLKDFGLAVSRFISSEAVKFGLVEEKDGQTV